MFGIFVVVCFKNLSRIKVMLLGMPEIATGLFLGVYMVKWHRVGFGEGHPPAATFPFKELKGGCNRGIPCHY